jgi:hypothetical protein
MFNFKHFDAKWSIRASRVVTWLASGHSRTARTSILNNYNREGRDPGHPNPDILICTTGKLGGGENLTGGNWLVLFEPPNSIITWKQAAARNVRLGMKEPTLLEFLKLPLRSRNWPPYASLRNWLRVPVRVC